MTEEKLTAWCVKCKKKVEIENQKEATLKNKRRAMKGNCPECKTKVCRILGK